VTIHIDEEGTGRATFSCQVDARLIASGAIEFTLGTEAQAERV
jgi:hypothetical protein